MKSRAVLLSMSPDFAFPVVDGVKTIDLRRKFPLGIPKGTRVLIYATAPVSKVVGEARLEEVESLELSKLWKKAVADSQVSRDFFDGYFRELPSGFAVHLAGARRYKQPRDLELATGVTRPPRSYRYL
jgi:predicted transcriptional regulator